MMLSPYDLLLALKQLPSGPNYLDLETLEKGYHVSKGGFWRNQGNK